MKDDQLLEAMGRSVREERGLDDPQWEDLVKGNLSAQEEAELRKRYPGKDSPYELFKPLDADEEKDLDRRLAAAGRAQSVSVKEKRVLSARTPRVLYLLAAAFAIAVAFGVFIFVRSHEPASMVAYSMVTTGGDKTQLGNEPAATDTVRLSPGSRLALTLNPATPVDGALTVRAFLVSPLETRLWDPPLVGSKGGIFKIEGTREVLFDGVPPGEWELVFIVGRPESIPPEAKLRDIVKKGEFERGFVMMRQKLFLLAEDANLRSIDVQFAGCAAVREGPVCEVREDDEIRIWLPTSQQDIMLTFDGITSKPTRNEMEGGVQLVTKVPKGARELSLKLDKKETAFFGLKLDPFLADAKDLVELETLRKGVREASKKSATEAFELAKKEISRARALGRISHEARETFYLSHKLIYDAVDLHEAENRLAEIALRQTSYPEAMAQILYLQGIIAYERGDDRAALRFLRDSTKASERLGLSAIRTSALQMWAAVLTALGRHDEAMKKLDDVRGIVLAEGKPCALALYDSNRGFMEWSSASEKSEIAAAKSRLEGARSVAQSNCPDLMGEILTNLALADVSLGNYTEAKRSLDEARSAMKEPDPRLEPYLRFVEAKNLAAAGRNEAAIRVYDELGEKAKRVMRPEMILDAYAGKARALAALGKAPEACASYRDASRELDDWSRNIPLGEGRDKFFANQKAFTAEHIEFLLRLSEHNASSTCERVDHVARHSIARFFASLRGMKTIVTLSPERRLQWNAKLDAYKSERATFVEKYAKNPENGSYEAERASLREKIDAAMALLDVGGSALSSERELSTPGEGEVFLIYHPMIDGAWVGIAVSSEGVVTRRLGHFHSEAPANERAALLLEPFRSSIEKASHIRILAASPVVFEDIHRLPWQGRTLLDHVFVTYGIDAETSATAKESQRALLIVDPREDIPLSRHAADTIERSLRARGWVVDRVNGAAATREAVLRAMEQSDVRLLHYAGHGAFEGEDGLEAALLLAGGERLTAADILSMKHVPSEVVLAGCETGRTEAVSHNGAAGLGLAQAFVLRGARHVVAAREPVLDKTAASLFERFYAVEDGAPLDIIKRLGVAQRAFGSNPEMNDAGFFRAIVP